MRAIIDHVAEQEVELAGAGTTARLGPSAAMYFCTGGFTTKRLPLRE